MLSIFRQNLKPVLLILTIIICAAFGWFYVRYDTGQGAGGVAYGIVYGEEIHQRDIDMMRRHVQVASEMQLPGVEELTSPRLMPGGGYVAYAAAIKIVRREAQRLGLAVGADEIEQAVRTLAPFQTNGQFDGAKFRLYAGTDRNDGLTYMRRTMRGEEMVGPLKLSRYGMTIEDFYKVVADYVLFQKLQDVVGAGIPGPDLGAQRMMALSGQKIDAQAISFPVERYKEGIKPTDEDVQKAYDAEKARFMTPVKKNIEYVVIAAKTPPAPATPADPKPGETAEPKPAENPAPTETPEAAKARAEVAEKVSDGLADGVEFAKLAADLGLELKTTGAIAMDDMPADLKDKNHVLSAISALSPTLPIPPPIAEGTAWYILKLKELVEPQQKPLAEVRADVEKDVIAEKARAAATTAAKEAAAKLKTALDGGATFEKAATDAGLAVEKYPGLDRTTAAQQPLARPLIVALQYLKPGSLAPEPVNTPEAVLVACLLDRTLERNPAKAEEIEGIRGYMSQMRRSQVFFEWWGSRVAAAKVVDRTVASGQE